MRAVLISLLFFLSLARLSGQSAAFPEADSIYRPASYINFLTLLGFSSSLYYYDSYKEINPLLEGKLGNGLIYVPLSGGLLLYKNYGLAGRYQVQWNDYPGGSLVNQPVMIGGFAEYVYKDIVFNTEVLFGPSWMNTPALWTQKYVRLEVQNKMVAGCFSSGLRCYLTEGASFFIKAEMTYYRGTGRIVVYDLSPIYGPSYKDYERMQHYNINYQIATLNFLFGLVWRFNFPYKLGERKK